MGAIYEPMVELALRCCFHRRFFFIQYLVRALKHLVKF